MPKAQELLMDGEIFDPDKPSETVEKVRKFLDDQPKNELFIFAKLHARVKVGENSLRKFARDPKFSAYVYSRGTGKEWYFGHPAAIALLRSKLEGK